MLLTARALARKTVSPAAIAKAGVVLRRDEDHSPEVLVEKLMATGYVREDPVGAVGEFSMRGGIVDVWPPGREAPVRLEFFGDTIDSLREFDPENQLSTGQLQSGRSAADARVRRHAGRFPALERSGARALERRALRALVARSHCFR